MEQIADYSHYTRLMRNGFYDKLWFVDKIFGDWHTLVDYGCADGFFTKLLGSIYPDKQIIGYDSDPKMVETAQYTGQKMANVTFTNTPPKGDLLVLSSVLHELYSYGTEEEIKGFWQYVYGTGFKFIVIRDMCELLQPPLPESTLKRCAKKVTDWAYKNHLLGEIYRFEELFGPIAASSKNLTHFLLKYLYINSPNWNREIAEDYMSVHILDIINAKPADYEFTHREGYNLPYLRMKWLQDFQIGDIQETHCKIIIEKKHETVTIP